MYGVQRAAGWLNGVWRCESPFDEFFKRWKLARVANLLPLLNSFAEQELKGSGLLQLYSAHRAGYFTPAQGWAV